MLVVQVSRFGGPEVLAARQAPDPVPPARASDRKPLHELVHRGRW